MSVLTTLFYLFFAPQEATASAVFAVSGANGLATVVAKSGSTPAVITGGGTGRWWMPFTRRVSRVPQALYITGRGGAVVGGSACVDYLNDTLSDEELMLLLELEMI